MIKNFKKKSGFAIVCAVLLTVVLTLGAGLTGAYGVTNLSIPNYQLVQFANVNEMMEIDAVINLRNRNGQHNISESGSFVAEADQLLTLRITSSIRGGEVDLFLFAPDGTEHRFTIGRTLLTIHQIELTEGVWAYNVSGIFRDGGNITIVGTLNTFDLEQPNTVT